MTLSDWINYAQQNAPTIGRTIGGFSPIRKSAMSAAGTNIGNWIKGSPPAPVQPSISAFDPAGAPPGSLAAPTPAYMPGQAPAAPASGPQGGPLAGAPAQAPQPSTAPVAPVAPMSLAPPNPGPSA